MVEPQSNSGAESLAKQVYKHILNPSHPVFHAFPWLIQQVRTCSIPEGNWLDIATGDGNTLIATVAESNFSGNLLANEADLSMMEKVKANFKRSKLTDRIRLVSMVLGAEELADEPMPHLQCISATDFWHEGYSYPALLVDSHQIGLQKYREAMKTINYLVSGGYLFTQDRHGIKDNSRAFFKYHGENSEIARHLVNWIIDPSYSIPDKFLDPNRIDRDNEFWTPKRREVLTKKATWDARVSPSSECMPLNVLIEAAYRVEEVGPKMTKITYASRDHKIHCALTGNRIIKDIQRKGMNVLGRYKVKDEHAKDFFLNAGIQIVQLKIPPIYTAAVLQKQ